MKNKERQRSFREKKRAEGETYLQLWIRPEWKKKIKAFIDSLKQNKS